MMSESMAGPVLQQTLAAWRATLVRLRDEERRRGTRLSAETGRLLEVVGQALAEGGGVLAPTAIDDLETRTGIGAQYRAVD